jgi:SAM-dependent methyltransferase
VVAINEDRYEARRKRGQRIWDRGARRYSWPERASTPIHPLIVANLQPLNGWRVLDIGCGRGAFFETLRNAVGSSGSIVGVDYSPKMVQQAMDRIDEHGWTNVEVRQADFAQRDTTLEGFDAAIAIASLSAMPDIPAALANAEKALRPGGQLFVFDFRLRPRGRGWMLLSGLGVLYRALAGWTGVDVLDVARATFDRVELVAPEGRSADENDVVIMFVATKAPR